MRVRPGAYFRGEHLKDYGSGFTRKYYNRLERLERLDRHKYTSLLGLLDPAEDFFPVTLDIIS
jgi:hypothetical protein